MKDKYDLKKMIQGSVCTLYFVTKNGVSNCENEMIKLSREGNFKYVKLMAFLKKIAENGTDLWKMNPEKYKYIKNVKGESIWEIKTHGLRVLDIEKGKGCIILLDVFKKKQNESSKKNQESIKRSENLVKELKREGIV